MAVLPSVENRLLDEVESILQGIGTPSTEWRTAPIVTRGVPSDAVLKASAPHVFIHYLGTESAPGDNGLGPDVHWWRIRLAVWVLDPSLTVLLNAKADVAKAIFQNEQTIGGLFGQPLWIESFTPRDDMAPTGFKMGFMSLFLDTPVAHSTT